MTKFSALAFVLACAAAAPPPVPVPVPPAPRAPAGLEFLGSSYSAPAATLTVTHRITPGNDGNGAMDSIAVTETVAAVVQRQTLTGGLAQTVSFQWTAAAGQTITGTICATAWRRLRSSSPPTCRAFSATAADVPPPPPVIDTLVIGLEVKPDSVKLLPGAEVTFCAFVKFAGGAVAMRALEAPECAPEYAKLPAPARVVNATQQGIADAICVLWSATGGTIAQEACAGPPGFDGARARGGARVMRVELQ